jgi:hypothetical protein
MLIAGASMLIAGMSSPPLTVILGDAVTLTDGAGLGARMSISTTGPDGALTAISGTAL